MNTLNLELETGGVLRPLPFTVRRMVNIGYSGRDQAVVRAHIEELRAQGVPPPARVPLCIPVVARQLAIDDEIEVLPGKTSGEAEIVFLLAGRKILVGVGSDHTDRDLETLNVEKSKQICPNQMSQRVWRFDDVASRWDALLLKSWFARGGEWTPYQDAPLSRLLPPAALLDHAMNFLGGTDREGLVVYSGTVPLLGHPANDADAFRCELWDEAAGRRLTCEYRIRTLNTAVS